MIKDARFAYIDAQGIRRKLVVTDEIGRAENSQGLDVGDVVRSKRGSVRRLKALGVVGNIVERVKAAAAGDEKTL